MFIFICGSAKIGFWGIRFTEEMKQIGLSRNSFGHIRFIDAVWNLF